MALKRLELPPPRVLLLVLSAFLGFLALEGFLFWAYRDMPLRLSLLDLLFWGALMLWSVSVRVPLPLSASMSQFFIFALALIALTSPWVPPFSAFCSSGAEKSGIRSFLIAPRMLWPPPWRPWFGSSSSRTPFTSVPGTYLQGWASSQPP